MYKMLIQLNNVTLIHLFTFADGLTKTRRVVPAL